MSILNNIKLKPKLVGGFLFAGVAPIIVITFIFSTRVQEVVMINAFNQLEAVQKIKKVQIESFFNERKGDIEVLAQNGNAAGMYVEMKTYAEEMATGDSEPLDISLVVF